MMMINRRRVYGGKSLPYDYEVEYLGNFTLRSPVVVNSLNFKIYAKLKAEDLLGVNDYCSFGLYLCYNDPWDESRTIRLLYFLYWYGKDFYVQIGNARTQTLNYSYFINKIVDIEVGNFYVKDRTNNTYIYNGNIVKSMNFGNLTPRIEFTHSLCYYEQIYIDGECVCDLIPVVDKQGVGCMYDKVSKQLYYSTLSTNPVIGPRVS